MKTAYLGALALTMMAALVAAQTGPAPPTPPPSPRAGRNGRQRPNLRINIPPAQNNRVPGSPGGVRAQTPPHSPPRRSPQGSPRL
ncbi:hypothetical protein H4R34_004438 [Dimargaris verticillata]|uniref:Uncharacterized protein n=1 Tax=Dimargaris verticillata TaxID=2761393 RepID=A0A9W8E847_9FUNG|nr:hypothetical protein H4R34_004438 [Dimargaris verticillata]